MILADIYRIPADFNAFCVWKMRDGTCMIHFMPCKGEEECEIRN